MAVPSIVTNVTVPLLGLVDLAIVGHIGNETMIGAIAVGSMVFNVMYWLMGFLRMGTTGTTAQEYGVLKKHTSVQECEGRDAGIAPLLSILSKSLRIALLIALAMLVLQVPLRWLSLWLMGPSAEVTTLVRIYFNTCIWGAPAVLSLYVMTGWFIGMQDTRTPMVVSIAQNVINIIASLVLVFGFRMQIEGVALGTLIAQWSGATMAFMFVERKRGGTSFMFSPLRIRLCRLRSEVGARTGIRFPSWSRNHISDSPKAHSPQREEATFQENKPKNTNVGFLQANRDLFLRTLCLVAVNLFFTSAGARQGDLLLSVNTLLMTFFTLFSYVMDGFANAGEALSGKYYGADDWTQFHKVNKCLLMWGWLMVALFTLAYAVGGRCFLGLLTSEQAVVDAAMTYLPWTLLIPISGMAAFVYDGIFIGMMETKGMLVSCAIATAAFFALHFLLFPVAGNHALWLALIVYLALRGVVQYFWIRK